MPAIKIFERIDILFLTVGFLGSLAGTSFVYLNVVEYLCRMLPNVKRVLIVTAVGFCALLIGLLVQNIKDVDKLLVDILTYTGVFTAFIIPTVLLIIAKVKKHGNKKAA